MSFRLKEAVFKVRCREPGCPFNSEFSIKENIMGVTEADVDSEALKIAKNMGSIKHDSIYGRKHPLVNPEIFKTSSSYERIGGLTANSVSWSPAASGDHSRGHVFHRGEVIFRKNEPAAMAYEVIRGSAVNLGHSDLRYRAGAILGTAALFNQKSRPVDVVAAEDDTEIAIHNVKEITKIDPARARELFDRALEDVFHVLLHFEAKLKKLESRKAAPKAARRPRTASKPLARAPRKAPRKTPSTKRKTLVRGRKR